LYLEETLAKVNKVRIFSRVTSYLRRIDPSNPKPLLLDKPIRCDIDRYTILSFGDIYV
jgi:hypothetical protein